MTLHVSLWWLPIALTIAIWVTTLLWPMSSQGGGAFDIGGALEVLLRGFAAVVSTLIVWLIFFLSLWIVA